MTGIEIVDTSSRSDQVYTKNKKLMKSIIAKNSNGLVRYGCDSSIE